MAVQFWVVNVSPSVAVTKYAIVRGTFAQAESQPNAGGISGPYATLEAAYKVYKNEPQNKNLSSITLIGQALGAGAGYAVYGDTPSSVVGAAATGGNVADSTAGVLGGIWSKLNSRGTWIRVAEATLGIALILVALAEMTGAPRVIDLPATIAKQAGKAAKVTK
jgi:hypothetical protein